MYKSDILRHYIVPPYPPLTGKVCKKVFHVLRLRTDCHDPVFEFPELLWPTASKGLNISISQLFIHKGGSDFVNHFVELLSDIFRCCRVSIYDAAKDEDREPSQQEAESQIVCSAVLA